MGVFTGYSEVFVVVSVFLEGINEALGDWKWGLAKSQMEDFLSRLLHELHLWRKKWEQNKLD